MDHTRTTLQAKGSCRVRLPPSPPISRNARNARFAQSVSGDVIAHHSWRARTVLPPIAAWGDSVPIGGRSRFESNAPKSPSSVSDRVPTRIRQDGLPAVDHDRTWQAWWQAVHPRHAHYGVRRTRLPCVGHVGERDRHEVAAPPFVSLRADGPWRSDERGSPRTAVAHRLQCAGVKHRRSLEESRLHPRALQRVATL